MPRPSERVVEILRRAAAVPVTIRTERRRDVLFRWAAYTSGEALTDAKGYPIEVAGLCHLVRKCWLLPGEDVGLFRARALAEGEAPETRKEEEVGEQKPTPQQTAILRRISTHKLVVGFVDGRKGYSYGDGVPVRRDDAERIIRNRWVVPESPGLLRDEEAQSYVCRGLPR